MFTGSWIFIVIFHWNNSLQIDMSPHSDTLSWFQANHFIVFVIKLCRVIEHKKCNQCCTVTQVYSQLVWILHDKHLLNKQLSIHYEKNGSNWYQYNGFLILQCMSTCFMVFFNFRWVRWTTLWYRPPDIPVVFNSGPR